MAEIKIEKKKPIWPWVLLGIIVIALLVYFVSVDDDPEEMNEVPQTTDTLSSQEVNGTDMKEDTIGAYVSFVESSPDSMGIDHQFTNEALSRLIDATKAKAAEVDYNVEADLDKVEQYAEKIEKDPYETSHADNIRNAADILTNVLQNIQQANYPELSNEAAELNDASESIKKGTLTLEQKDAVKNFFNKSAELLHKMN